MEGRLCGERHSRDHLSLAPGRDGLGLSGSRVLGLVGMEIGRWGFSHRTAGMAMGAQGAGWEAMGWFSGRRDRSKGEERRSPGSRVSLGSVVGYLGVGAGFSGWDSPGSSPGVLVCLRVHHGTCVLLVPYLPDLLAPPEDPVLPRPHPLSFLQRCSCQGHPTPYFPGADTEQPGPVGRAPTGPHCS